MVTATATHPAAAAGTIAATAAMQESLLHGRMDLLIGAVRQQQEENRKNNTQLAYDPKKEEWYQFCYHSYGNSIGATTVLPERLFRFLFYQAFRSRRSRGKKSPFDPAECDNIIEEYSTHFRNGQSIPDPPDPVSFQTLSTYRASVRSIWEEQSAASANSLSWDQVYKKPCRDLFKAVQSRSTRVARIRFDEKIDGEFSPFTTLGQVGNIEAELFSNGTQTQKDALPSLRNRFVFLNCYSGLLRHESLFLGEFSDMVGLSHRRRKDAAEMFIMVMQIATGKTVHAGGKRQFGRCLRHRDVNRCPIGAFGMYLLYRFYTTKEMDDGNRPDFTRNETWFGLKILGSTTNPFKSVTKRSYCDALGKVFKRLRMICSVLGHWGRKHGPIELEFEEIAPDIIKLLGNWEMGVQESTYSAKIPTMALRVMAGFEADDSYWVPRCNVEPPEDLLKEVFPWLDGELERVQHSSEVGGGDRPTAVCTLMLWKNLRRIVIQDAAEMLIKDPGRRRHFVFTLPVFSNPLFSVRSVDCCFCVGRCLTSPCCYCRSLC
jgi:hypothetical protein